MAAKIAELKINFSSLYCSAIDRWTGLCILLLLFSQVKFHYELRLLFLRAIHRLTDFNYLLTTQA